MMMMKREREREKKTKKEIIMNFDEEIGGKIKIIEKKIKYILYILGGEKIDKVNPKSVEDYIFIYINKNSLKIFFS